MSISPVSITRTCVALVWVFSYPNRPIPAALSIQDILHRDVETVAKLARGLFPMMRDACDQVVQLHSCKAVQNVSPTSVVQTETL